MTSKINQEKMNNSRYIDRLYITTQLIEKSEEQHEALSFGLDTHIPVKVNKNAIYTELEVFFQSILKDISKFPENELRQTKANLRNTCDKYTKIIKVPYKYRKVVKKLSETKDIAILKVDKGRGVVSMNRYKYAEKSLQMLNTNQFVTLNSDPTKTTERKVENVKLKFSPNKYKQLYPTGSYPGKLYGTAKTHKLSQGDQVEKRPIRPTVSNIDTC